MYDHQTETLWSQLKEMAIAGPLAATELQTLPSRKVSWETYRKNNPTAPVLSKETGYDRDYSVDPYEGYARVLGLWFPVGDVRKDLPPKDRVMGVSIDGQAKAYPLKRIQQSPGTITDSIGDREIKIHVSKKGEVLSVKDENGHAVTPVFSYWFSWQAFHHIRPFTTNRRTKFVHH